MRPVLIIPGIYNSGPLHWQSLWQSQHAGVARVEQADWSHPVCGDWVARLDAAVAQASAPPVLVAHSLGCLAVAHWAARSARAVRGLVLVAVPDPLGSRFPADAQGFAPVPTALALPGQPARPTLLVSSANDPYSTPTFAAQCAAAWGAEARALGPLGHFNADSGLGDWPEGWAWVQRWRAE